MHNSNAADTLSFSDENVKSILCERGQQLRGPFVYKGMMSIAHFCRTSM